MKKSYLIAAAFTGVIILWMLSGLLIGNGGAGKEKDNSERETFSVETIIQKQQPVNGYIIAQGNIEPNREVTILAQTDGKITKILIDKGNKIVKGDVIMRLDMKDREIRLERAKARVSETKRKYEAAKNLGQKGYAARTRIDEALVAVKDAQAEYQNIKIEIENTYIRAPFDGIINKRFVEIGDYASIKDPLLSIVDNTPLVAHAAIPQNKIGSVRVGGLAIIKINSGDKTYENNGGDNAVDGMGDNGAITGKIRYIAPRADDMTRSFRIEIEIPNPDNMPSGFSADIYIPQKAVMAHFISPGILTLDEQGNIGVKTIEGENIVKFYPVKIISSQADGIYVTGLPDKAQIIINGQGFVRDGEKVKVTLKENKATSLDDHIDGIDSNVDSSIDNAKVNNGDDNNSEDINSPLPPLNDSPGNHNTENAGGND